MQASDEPGLQAQAANQRRYVLANPALLATALFLFGLAQAASVRTRRTFTVFGSVVLAASFLWALSIVIDERAAARVPRMHA